MERPKNKIPEKTQRFLRNMENYLNTKFVYYGSVQRPDYMPDGSDIDVAIFTDNESSTISQIKAYLHLKDTKVRKFVWKLHSGSKRTIYGYKLKYKNKQQNIYIEFAIYNNRFKQDLLHEYKRKIVLPYISICVLNILKIFYYKLHLISFDWYRYLKNKVLTLSVGTPDDNFIVLPN